MSEMKNFVTTVIDAYKNGMTFDGIVQAYGVSYDLVAQIIETAIEDDPTFFDDADVDPAEYDYSYDADFDGQPDEAQEWHDFDPDC